jgi:hypothetical protein
MVEEQIRLVDQHGFGHVEVIRQDWRGGLWHGAADVIR